jgi:homoserine kinase type II
MAVYTQLHQADARRIAEAHDLGVVAGITPIPAGSVNSNFFLDTDRGRWFCRIYEEQESDGVAYEWELLSHLRRQGLPVPERVAGPGPGEMRVAGKPTAVFELVGGRESCQAAVTPVRAEAVGRLLASAHLATDDFSIRRRGRFTRADVRTRLDEAEAAERPELADPISRVRAALDEIDADLPADLPTGVVHGDLFRDNVRWEGDTIVAMIDWESASDEARVYDLAVTVLAWCWGDALEPELARAMCTGYDAERSLSEVERAGLRLVLMAAAARFTATRITDYYLRGDQGGSRVMKDYRRFVARLEWAMAMKADALAESLGLS